MIPFIFMEEAVAATFGAKASNLVGKLLTGTVVVVGIIIFAAIVIGIAFYIRYLRKFNVIVEIKSKRSSGSEAGMEIYKIIPDKGGIMRSSRTKTTWFRLLGQKVDLPVPPNECFQLDSKGNNHLYIWHPSDEEYYFLLPDKIVQSVIVRGGQSIALNQAHMKIVDSGAAYWGQVRKRENRKLFDIEGLLWKLAPLVGMFLMFMLVIFLTYLITSHWGEFAAAANALKEAAQALAGTTHASVTTG